MPLHDWSTLTGWEGVHSVWNVELLYAIKPQLPPAYRAHIGATPTFAIGGPDGGPDGGVRDAGDAPAVTPAADPGREPDEEVAVATLGTDTAVLVERAGRLVAAIELVWRRNEEWPSARGGLRGDVHGLPAPRRPPAAGRRPPPAGVVLVRRRGRVGAGTGPAGGPGPVRGRVPGRRFVSGRRAVPGRLAAAAGGRRAASADATAPVGGRVGRREFGRDLPAGNRGGVPDLSRRGGVFPPPPSAGIVRGPGRGNPAPTDPVKT